MKILQIFGAVVAVHLLAFIFIFASPGCQSGPRNIPTPDATMPTGTAAAPAPIFSIPAAPQPVDLGTAPVAYNPASAAGHSSPTRPGSAAAVAITPAKPVAEVTSTMNYTVVRGDSLWTIAKKHNLTVNELAKLNGMSAGVALRPGQKLMIPTRGAPAATAATEAPRNLGTLTQQPKQPADGEAIKHTVAVGESLGVIARHYQVSVGELAAANNITDPSKVRAGQQLAIPGFKAVTAKGVTTPAPKSGTPPADTSANPRFELTPPPPGQDLDAGLKEGSTEVPTIKVEEKPKG